MYVQDCVDRFSSRHAFMGFIDVDEFVTLYDTSITRIDDLLRRSVRGTNCYKGQSGDHLLCRSVE